MGPEPFRVPTVPADIPSYTGVDPDNGLHVAGTPQVIDLVSYRLKVRGKVVTPLNLSYVELRLLPKVTATPTLVCPGVFQDTATWSGVPLKTIIDSAEGQPGAWSRWLHSFDGHVHALSTLSDKVPEDIRAGRFWLRRSRIWLSVSF